MSGDITESQLADGVGELRLPLTAGWRDLRYREYRGGRSYTGVAQLSLDGEPLVEVVHHFRVNDDEAASAVPRAELVTALQGWFGSVGELAQRAEREDW